MVSDPLELELRDSYKPKPLSGCSESNSGSLQEQPVLLTGKNHFFLAQFYAFIYVFMYICLYVCTYLFILRQGLLLFYQTLFFLIKF